MESINMSRLKSNLRTVLFVLGLLQVTAVHAGTDRLRVGFLCPKPPDQGFWGQVIQVMQAAAEDLNVELIVKRDPSGSTIGRKRAGVELLNIEPKLDVMLSGYWTSITKFHLELAKERGIKMFIFNADIKDDELEEVGKPRGKFDNWIGHMVPDDEAAAKVLIELLVNEAKTVKKITDGSVKVHALVSEGFSTVSRRRNAGLRSQVAAMPGTVLKETKLEFWKEDWALDETVKILKLDPHIDVIWAASQVSAWGAVLGVEKAGKIPGKDVLVGGFDWNQQSLAALAEGRMTASMFGHFMEGAWALLLVHDYHYGIDFANDVGIRIITPLTVIRAENYSRYKRVVDGSHWQEIDFRKLSKKYNPELKAYNFNIDQFLD
jgi:ABC-type sugar transport system substrate-binding protein